MGIYPDTGKMESPIAKMPVITKPEVNEANGRIIAAAPDLLDALRSILPMARAYALAYPHGNSQEHVDAAEQLVDRLKEPDSHDPGPAITQTVAQIKAEITPVDRSAIELAGGKPVTDDHREIDPLTGQQKGYVVLRPEERAKGFVRPYRDAYRHLKCWSITTMGRSIAETYARDPFFYSATFCTNCRGHFPIGEDGDFTWYEMDGSEGPKVGT